MRKVGVLAATLALLAGAFWWWQMPRTPQALFIARCSHCHELPDVCDYEPAARGEIVRIMRTEHKADTVINETEAGVIARYLKEALPCP